MNELSELMISHLDLRIFIGSGQFLELQRERGKLNHQIMVTLVVHPQRQNRHLASAPLCLCITYVRTSCPTPFKSEVQDHRQWSMSIFDASTKPPYVKKTYKSDNTEFSEENAFENAFVVILVVNL